MTQGNWTLVKIWLKELNSFFFFEKYKYDSKYELIPFWKYDSKTWTLLKYDSQNWTFWKMTLRFEPFFNMIQRIEPFFCKKNKRVIELNMTQKDWTLLKYVSKNCYLFFGSWVTELSFFSIWLKELNFFLKQKYDSKNWTRFRKKKKKQL